MIWPLIFTFATILTSWVSVSLIFGGATSLSFSIAIVAFIFDCMDGYLARKLKVESEMGRQLDSLSDVILYLIYPVIIFYYFFGFNDYFSVLVQGVFLISGIYRLARFNGIGFVKAKWGKAYPGMPVVFSFLLVIIVAILRKFSIANFIAVSDFLMLTQSLLMVSKIPFIKPKTSYVIIFLVFLLFSVLLYGKIIF